MSESESERVCGLNIVGPKQLNQDQSVRPVAPTGQTGPAQTDRSKLDLGDLSREFKLMTVISLIIED